MAQKSNAGEMAEKSGVIQRPGVLEILMQKLSLEAEIDAADNTGNSATQQTIERILNPELSDEELWNAGDLVNIGGRNLVDVEMTVHNFTVKRGNREDVESFFIDSEGRKYYLLIESTIDAIPTNDPSEFQRPPLEIGDMIVWNTSAPDILPKLVQFRDRGRFPLACVIRALDLGGGKHYLRLKPVPKRAVRGSMA